MKKSIILLLSMFLAAQVNTVCADDAVDGQSGATTVQDNSQNGNSNNQRGRKSVNKTKSKKSSSNTRNKKDGNQRGSSKAKKSASETKRSR